MNILEKIVAYKRLEVEKQKEAVPFSKLKAKLAGLPDVPSLYASLNSENKNGIISEFKRRSPSKDWINKDAVVEDVVPFYEEAGVSGISVLTDTNFFGGTSKDLIHARKVTSIPILRKDFIIDPYQILEARTIGASAILLIASVLSKQEVHELAGVAREYDLDILFEVHDLEELDKLSPLINIVGVNNRNLKTFEVTIENSVRIAQHIPDHVLKVAESGISTVDAILYLRSHGFNGFLIGENFMKTEDPGKAAIDFAAQL